LTAKNRAPHPELSLNREFLLIAFLLSRKASRVRNYVAVSPSVSLSSSGSLSAAACSCRAGFRYPRSSRFLISFVIQPNASRILNYPEPIVLDQIIAAKHDRLGVTGAVSRSSSRHVTK
jgi:hypothetical protein